MSDRADFDELPNLPKLKPPPLHLRLWYRFRLRVLRHKPALAAFPELAKAKRRKRRKALTVALAVVLILASLAYTVQDIVFPEMPPGTEEEHDDSAAVAEELAENPFAGTPAAEWPPAAELAMPKAKATGDWSKAEVAEMLETVRKTLLAGRVEWPLGDEKRDGYVERFAPDARSHVEDLLKGSDRINLVSDLADGGELDGPVVADGEITFKERERDGITVFSVNVKYVWAYAFEGERFRYGDQVVTVNERSEWEFPDAAQVASTSDGMWTGGLRFFASNIDCDLVEEGVLAPTPPEEYTYEGAQNDPDAPYDPHADLGEITGNCD